jgi:hypothetical protein
MRRAKAGAILSNPAQTAVARALAHVGHAAREDRLHRPAKAEAGGEKKKPASPPS